VNIRQSPNLRILGPSLGSEETVPAELPLPVGAAKESTCCAAIPNIIWRTFSAIDRNPSLPVRPRSSGLTAQIASNSFISA